jgi:hypothetical protein
MRSIPSSQAVDTAATLTNSRVVRFPAIGHAAHSASEYVRAEKFSDGSNTDYPGVSTRCRLHIRVTVVSTRAVSESPGLSVVSHPVSAALVQPPASTAAATNMPSLR